MVTEKNSLISDMLVTIVGTSLFRKKNVVMQYDARPIRSMVDIMVIEFDQQGVWRISFLKFFMFETRKALALGDSQQIWGMLINKDKALSPVDKY